LVTRGEDAPSAVVLPAAPKVRSGDKRTSHSIATYRTGPVDLDYPLRSTAFVGCERVPESFDLGLV
jgi:hypothetical protein